MALRISPALVRTADSENLQFIHTPRVQFDLVRQMLKHGSSETNAIDN